MRIRFDLVACVAIMACQTGFAAAPAPQTTPAAQVGPGYDIEMGRMIPMRDGVSLEAWITKPSHLAGRAPAVLELTQYDIDGGTHADPVVFARRGFVFVQAEVRGRGRSGGVKSDSLGLQVGRDGRARASPRTCGVAGALTLPVYGDGAVRATWGIAEGGPRVIGSEVEARALARGFAEKARCGCCVAVKKDQQGGRSERLDQQP